MSASESKQMIMNEVILSWIDKINVLAQCKDPNVAEEVITVSVEMFCSNDGGLRCELKHGPSAALLGTDAPVDNGGEGSAFSPTDLVGAALLSCALTTMALKAPKAGVPFHGATGRVEKIMTQEG